MELPGPIETLPRYPGSHPGTGENDHLHSWEWYRMDDPGSVLLIACQICGVPRISLYLRATRVELEGWTEWLRTK